MWYSYDKDVMHLIERVYVPLLLKRRFPTDIITEKLSKRVRFKYSVAVIHSSYIPNERTRYYSSRCIKQDHEKASHAIGHLTR